MLRMVNFVGHDEHGPPAGPQIFGDVAVVGEQAGAGVHDKEDDVSLLDRPLGLPAHLLLHRRPCRPGHAPGIDNCKFPAAPGCGRVEPVPRNTRDIFDDGFSLPNQPVEQRGLSHVGAPDNSHNRFAHGVKNGGERRRLNLHKRHNLHELHNYLHSFRRCPSSFSDQARSASDCIGRVD